MACALDSNSELSLMLSAGAGNSSGENFAALADALAKSAGVLVINEGNFVCTEDADLSSSAARHGTCGAVGIFGSIHFYDPSFRSYGTLFFPLAQKGRSSSVLISSNLGAEAAGEE